MPFTKATPTLGTIGGSGPATAAQNEWMRVVSTAGNVRYYLTGNILLMPPTPRQGTIDKVNAALATLTEK